MGNGTSSQCAYPQQKCENQSKCQSVNENLSDAEPGNALIWFDVTDIEDGVVFVDCLNSHLNEIFHHNARILLLFDF